MTPEQISALTLAELEQIAGRFEGAVKTIREAQALLGGSSAPAQAAPASAPLVEFNAAELMQREKLRRQFQRGEVSAQMADAMGVP